MSTKGPSNLYGNTKGTPTKHINFPYAKKFNDTTIDIHVDEHKNNVGVKNKREYKSKSIIFANEINLYNDSFVVPSLAKFDFRQKWTYKFNTVTKEFGIIDQNGRIISYFRPRSPEKYWNNVKRRFDVK